jgi:hypothetical protein
MRQVKAADAHGNSAPRARSAGASAEECSKYCGGAPTPPNPLPLPCPPPVGYTVARAHERTRYRRDSCRNRKPPNRSLAMPSVAYLPFLVCPPYGHNTLSLTHSPTRSLTQRFADHTIRLAGSSLQHVAASCAVLQQDDAAQHSECGRRPSGATRTRMAQSRARRRICAYGCSTGPSCTR